VIRCFQVRSHARVSRKWNLRTRPHSPNLGRGRLQRQIRRAFVAHGPVASSSWIYDWTHARCRRMTGNLRWSVLRILRGSRSRLVVPRRLADRGCGGYASGWTASASCHTHRNLDPVQALAR
jgi:hypothetical protein